MQIIEFPFHRARPSRLQMRSHLCEGDFYADTIFVDEYTGRNNVIAFPKNCVIKTETPEERFARIRELAWGHAQYSAESDTKLDTKAATEPTTRIK